MPDITDAGMRYLAKLKNLKHLSLGYLPANVTDSGF